MTVLYFSATGNGLYLAKKIGGRRISIPRAVKSGALTFQDDKIGIVFPIFALCVPPYIRDFLQEVQLKSNYIFALMSYGMMAGGAASHLLELSNENGIHFSYINSIRMVDNYLPNFEMERQKKGEARKQIEAHLQVIIDDISHNRQWVHKDSILDKLFTRNFLKAYPYDTGVGVTRKYSVENNCSQCATCAEVCPTDNIAVADAKPSFGEKCISCLSCIHNCPQRTIHILGEKSESRFRNQHISLAEICDSNN